MKIIYFFLFLTLFSSASCIQPKALVYQNVNNFGINQSGTDKTAISLDILLYNPNSYPLKLKNADVDVFMNGNIIGLMSVRERVSIPKLDTFSLPVVLDVDLQKVLPNAVQLLFNSVVDIKLTGTIKAGRRGVLLSMPVDYQGKQDIRSWLKW